MTIAFDASTVLTENSVNNSFTHTPVGTPRGVVVFIVQLLNDIDGPTAVTYGGVPMSHMTGSPNVKTTPEDGRAEAWFLGTGILTGARTVAVTGGSVARQRAIRCYTFTGAADIIEQDTDVTINSDSQASPINVTLALGGKDCWCGAAIYSGASTASTTPLSGWTADTEYAPGADTACIYSYDTVASIDVTAGYTTSASDDAIMTAIAITEDATAGAVLTSPAATATSGKPPESVGTVSTDIASAIQWVMTVSGTAPTAVQVVAGQDNSGSAATDSDEIASGGTGSQSTRTSLGTPGSSYYFHYLPDSGGDVDVVSSTQITLEAAFAGSATLSGATIPADSSLYVVGGTQTAAGGANVLTDSTLVDPDTGIDFVDNVLAGIRFVNRTDIGATAIVASNTGKTVTMGTITGGTANTIELGDAYDLVVAADINDVIYHETTARVVSAVGTYNQYIYDATADDYSATYTVTVRANGAPDGTYTIAMDTEGVITLTPVSAAFGIIQDLTRDLTQDLTRDIAG